MQKKIVAGIASGSMLVVGLSAFGVNEAMAKDVTLSVDGVPTDVRTYAGTVGEALDKQGIQVGDKDVVAPAVDTRLTEDTEISVQYARPVTVTIDGKEQTIWTTATSVEQVLHILELDAEDALSTSRSATIGRDGLEFDVTTNKNVTLKVDGRVEKPRNDELDTSARTVADLLKEHKVTTDDDDVVKPALNTVLKEGTVVDVTIVDPEADKREAEEKAAAQRAAEEKAAAERAAEQEAAAEREAAQQSKTVSTSSEADDDSSSSDSTSSASNSSSSSASSQKSSAPKSSASSSSSSSSKSSSGSSKSSGSSSSSSKSSSTKSSSPKPSKSSAPKKSSSSSSASTSTWDALAKCESGGNWSINTGNGYYGGLQFSPSSWRAAGGSGMPHQASKAEQIRVAENLKAKQGWGAWPACSAKLGLR